MANAPRLTAIANTQFLYNTAGSILTDASGNGFTLTNQNSAVYENGYDGSVNFAFDFNSSWFAYRTGSLNITATGDSTFQFYVKIGTAPSSSEIDLFSLVTNEGSGSRRVIQVAYIDTGGTKTVALRHGATTTSANQILTVGSWYGIAAVIDFTNTKAYLYVSTNGSVSKVIDVSLSSANSGNVVGLQIGSGTTGVSIPAAVNLGDFSIDNFRGTSTARTQSEIISDFAIPNNGNFLIFM